MTDREKLIELLNKQKGYTLPIWIAPQTIEILVDALIANGVTVQKWIPVTERLPEDYRDEYGELIPFLVCEEGTEYPYRAFYDGKNWGDGYLVVPVKWWMPLPKPPEDGGADHEN